MSSDREVIIDETEYLTATRIPLSILAWVILIPLLALQTKTRSSHSPAGARSLEAKWTDWLMLGVTSSNTIHQLSFIFVWFVCGHCRLIAISWGFTRPIIKGFNWLFLIHRAKLAQELQPLLSKRCFEQILPALSVVLTVGFVCRIIQNILNQEYKCVSYEDWEAIQFCIAKNNDAQKSVAALLLALDGFITIF